MPTVRPVRPDDEPTSTARPTRTDAYALRTGEPIQVRVNGRWFNGWISGQVHSELHVVTVRRSGRIGPRHLTKPEREER